MAGLQLIYGVTNVLNCQSKLILKVIQGHQGEESQWRVTTNKSIVDLKTFPDPLVDSLCLRSLFKLYRRALLSNDFLNRHK